MAHESGGDKTRSNVSENRFAESAAGKDGRVKTIYVNEIIPAFQATKGCRHEYLTLSPGDGKEAIWITIWDSKEAADEYEESGRFAHLIAYTH